VIGFIRAGAEERSQDGNHCGFDKDHSGENEWIHTNRFESTGAG
jgi:hypothetical protein